MIHDVSYVGHHIILTIYYQFPMNPNWSFWECSWTCFGEDWVEGSIIWHASGHESGEQCWSQISKLRMERGLHVTYREGHQGLGLFLSGSSDSSLPVWLMAPGPPACFTLFSSTSEPLFLLEADISILPLFFLNFPRSCLWVILLWFFYAVKGRCAWQRNWELSLSECLWNW